LCLLQAIGLVALMGKFSEIFELNRLDNSDQRWEMA